MNPIRVLLKDRAAGTYREAHVLDEIPREMFVRVRDSWQSYKQERAPLDGSQPQFASWDWYEKASSTTPEHHLFWALEVDGRVQGMLMLARTPVPSRRPGEEKKQVLYVEYLESAPWNNPVYAGEQAKFGQVGTGLIALAVRDSLQAGCDGRLGLHSLNTEQAQATYRRLGFLDLGFDEAEQYTYFELPGVSETEREAL